MSRLIKKPILIPKGVEVNLGDNYINIKGPRGTLSLRQIPLINIKIENNEIIISKNSESKQAKMNSGTMWSLISNAILGVTSGFQKILEIEGVGYRVELQDKNLILYLGYSHPINFQIPEGINVKIDKNRIIIEGINKELVGRVAAQIKSLRPPEPYKGKGIHYLGEVIKRKAGKKAVGGS